MNCPCRHAFTRTAFAGHKHRAVGHRHPGNHALDGNHRRRTEMKDAALARYNLTQRLILSFETAHRIDLRQSMHQFFIAHRLDDVIGSARTQRLDGCFNGSKRRDHDEMGINPGTEKASNQLDAIAIGHTDVAQGHVHIATHQFG
jgi:hypothetical protein